MTAFERLARFRLAAIAEFAAIRALGDEITAVRARRAAAVAEFAGRSRYPRNPDPEEAHRRHTAELAEIDAALELAEQLRAEHRERAQAADGNARAIARHLGQEY